MLLLIVKGPSKYKLQRWTVSTGSAGMKKITFPISSQPELGNYTIEASLNNTILATSSFTVELYNLPKFEISVTANPNQITSETKQISGTASAKYTYGKAVRGNVSIVILQKNPNIYYPQPMGGVMPEMGDVAVSAPFDPSMPSSPMSSGQILETLNLTLSEEGKVDFTVDLPFNDQTSQYNRYSYPPPYNTGNIEIQVIVKEDSTQHEETKSIELERVYSSLQLKLISQDIK